MKSRRNAYLPKLQISAPFLWQVQHSLDQFAPPLASKGLASPSSIPWDLAQNCSLLALAADVDASNAYLNMVLGDLDKLAVDPVAFQDVHPELRYRNLLRSAQMELDRLPDLFDQLLRLFRATGKLTQPQFLKLQTT